MLQNDCQAFNCCLEAHSRQQDELCGSSEAACSFSNLRSSLKCVVFKLLQGSVCENPRSRLRRFSLVSQHHSSSCPPDKRILRWAWILPIDSDSGLVSLAEKRALIVLVVYGLMKFGGELIIRKCMRLCANAHWPSSIFVNIEMTPANNSQLSRI